VGFGRFRVATKYMHLLQRSDAVMTDGDQQPTDGGTTSRGSGKFAIGLAIVLFIMTTGGFGIPMGAIFDDFQFGLTLGVSVGAVMATGIYFFVLRSGNRR